MPLPFTIVVLSYLFAGFFQSPAGKKEDVTGKEVIKDSISGLLLPEDLKAELWAESPQFYNPTNIDIDIKGRLWVTEAANYRNFNNDPRKFLHHEAGDRVIILQDTDGDGKCDSSVVFVQDKDLVSPLGIAVIGNKVIVSCAPRMIIYTDENGDDKPDHKEIFLKGFGGLDHDHSLHSLVAGPDGNWYFNTGNAGPHVVTDKAGFTLRSGSIYTGGTPYNTENKGGMVSDDGRVWVGGLALRISPEGKGLKVLGHNFRNAYELAVDSYGNFWQNDNDDQVVTCRTTWLMEGGNAGYFSADGTRFWQADQRPGQETFTAHWHQEDPGVIPAGDNTGAGSPTGIVMNESDALGKQYRGMLLSADAGRNLIFAYKPEPLGAGFDLKRIDLIGSVREDNSNYVWNDSTQFQDQRKWFRPSDVAIGTDGAMYIADWYDPVVGGHQMQDKTGYGRIYRITPKNGMLKAPVVDLGTTEGQIEALKNPAVNVRNLGFQALRQQGEKAVPAVAALLTSENPYHAARAVWLLSCLGNAGVTAVKAVLQHPDPQMRITAFRALRQVSADIIPLAEQLANDSSAAVKREVAIALRDLPADSSRNILIKLSEAYKGNDRWYLEALGAAMEKQRDLLFPVLRQKLGSGTPVAWSQPFCDLVWRLHPVAAVADLRARANAAELSLIERKRALVALAFINNRKAMAAMNQLASNGDDAIRSQAKWWLDFRKTNDWFAFSTGALTETTPAAAASEKSGVSAKKLPAKKAMPPAPTGRSYSISSIAKLKPDAKNGRTVFSGACAACHKAGNIGKEIGPDLTRIGDKLDRKNLLEAIVRPSAAIVFGYEPWQVTTINGKSFYGFLVADGNTVVIKDVAGQLHPVAATNIKTRKKMDRSIMPEPEALGLDEKELADVAEFLLRLTSK